MKNLTWNKNVLFVIIGFLLWNILLAIFEPLRSQDFTVMTCFITAFIGIVYFIKFKSVVNFVLLLMLPIAAFSQDTLSVVDHLLGGITLSKYAAGYIFAFAGIIMVWLFKLNRGLKPGKRGPDKFSWSFLWSDNWLAKISSVVLNFIGIGIYFRFAPELGEFVGLPETFTMYSAILVGLSIDYLVDRLVSKSRKNDDS